MRDNLTDQLLNSPYLEKQSVRECGEKKVTFLITIHTVTLMMDTIVPSMTDW